MNTLKSMIQVSRRVSTVSSILLIGILLVFSQGCTCKKKFNAMVDERDDCVSEKHLLEMHVDSLEAENELLYTKLVLQKTGTAVIHALYEELVLDLKTEIVSNLISVQEMKSGIVLLLSDDVLFPSGSAELGESGGKMLRKVGADLKEVPFQVLVIGFTDNVPVGSNLIERYPTNWELSGARAASVVRVLEASGVATEQMRAVALGENMPIASNDTAEGRAKNRRIEIRLRPVVVAE